MRNSEVKMYIVIYDKHCDPLSKRKEVKCRKRTKCTKLLNGALHYVYSRWLFGNKCASIPNQLYIHRAERNKGRAYRYILNIMSECFCDCCFIFWLVLFMKLNVFINVSFNLLKATEVKDCRFYHDCKSFF